MSYRSSLASSTLGFIAESQLQLSLLSIQNGIIARAKFTLWGPSVASDCSHVQVLIPAHDHRALYRLHLALQCIWIDGKNNIIRLDARAKMEISLSLSQKIAAFYSAPFLPLHTTGKKGSENPLYSVFHILPTNWDHVERTQVDDLRGKQFSTISFSREIFRNV